MLTAKRMALCSVLTLSGFILIPWSAATSQDDRPGNDSGDYATETIKLLEQSFDARKNMILTDVKMQNSDEDQIDELEQQLETFELAHEEAEFRLELMTEERAINRLLAELQEEGLDQFTAEARSLLELLHKRTQLADQLFRELRSDSDSDESSGETELETAIEEFEVRHERLHLQIEIHYAEQEGDVVAADELRNEIQELSDDQSTTATPDPDQ